MRGSRFFRLCLWAITSSTLLILLVSCGEPLSERINRIKLTHIQGFLSPEQCDHLITIAQNKFERSPVVTGTTTNTSPARTSYTHFFNKSQDDIIKAIEHKASQYVKRPVEKLESLQIVRYLPGQEFKAHYDWFQPQFVEINNVQREFTIFVYLNDVEEGGETAFPYLDVEFKPKKGDAVFWENCTSKTTCHEDAYHQGKPPVRGIKYGLNIWTDF